MRGGQPEVAETIDDDALAPRRATSATSRSSRSSTSRRTCASRSKPAVARSARSRSCRRDRDGSFGPADLVLAEEFAAARRARARQRALYSERDHVARALQSSLLPPSLPAIPGRTVTARYRAAGEGNEVGGDFYHVFQVDREAWWFVIGDVSGKGPEAAAIAGLARHTLRALALHERSPRHLLTALHDTLLVGEGARRVLHGVLRAARAERYRRRRRTSRSRAVDIRRRSSGAPTTPSKSRRAPVRSSGLPVTLAFVGAVGAPRAR